MEENYCSPRMPMRSPQPRYQAQPDSREQGYNNREVRDYRGAPKEFSRPPQFNGPPAEFRETFQKPPQRVQEQAFRNTRPQFDRGIPEDFEPVPHFRGPQKEFGDVPQRFPARNIPRDAPPRGFPPRDAFPREFAQREGPSREFAPREFAAREFAPRDPREFAPREFMPREFATREFAPRDFGPRDFPPSREFLSRDFTREVPVRDFSRDFDPIRRQSLERPLERDFLRQMPPVRAFPSEVISSPSFRQPVHAQEPMLYDAPTMRLGRAFETPRRGGAFEYRPTGVEQFRNVLPPQSTTPRFGNVYSSDQEWTSPSAYRSFTPSASAARTYYSPASITRLNALGYEGAARAYQSNEWTATSPFKSFAPQAGRNFYTRPGPATSDALVTYGSNYTRPGHAVPSDALVTYGSNWAGPAPMLGGPLVDDFSNSQFGTGVSGFPAGWTPSSYAPAAGISEAAPTATTTPEWLYSAFKQQHPYLFNADGTLKEGSDFRTAMDSAGKTVPSSTQVPVQQVAPQAQYEQQQQQFQNAPFSSLPPPSFMPSVQSQQQQQQPQQQQQQPQQGQTEFDLEKSRMIAEQRSI